MAIVGTEPKSNDVPLRMRILKWGGGHSMRASVLRQGGNERKRCIMADGQLHLPDAMFGTRRCANRGLMELGCEAELRALCGLAADGVRARSRSPRRGKADDGAIVPLRLPEVDEIVELAAPPRRRRTFEPQSDALCALARLAKSKKAADARAEHEQERREGAELKLAIAMQQFPLVAKLFGQMRTRRVPQPEVDAACILRLALSPRMRGSTGSLPVSQARAVAAIASVALDLQTKATNMILFGSASCDTSEIDVCVIVHQWDESSERIRQTSTGSSRAAPRSHTFSQIMVQSGMIVSFKMIDGDVVASTTCHRLCRPPFGCVT